MAKMLSDKPEIEYVDGQPFPKVSPKRTHAVVQLAIASEAEAMCRGTWDGGHGMETKTHSRY